MSIEVQHLTKAFDAQIALDDCSFSARKGEILGFLGPNGAGKSTTMKIATTYLRATAGTVKVCGHDVDRDPKMVRKKIGYLPEHNPLYLDMYVREYLDFVSRLHGLSKSLRSRRVEEVIRECGLQREQNKRIESLSKGYRQRVGLAQAIIHDPEVLILDEPTSGLDPNQILEIRNLIKGLAADKTVMLSTHIMQEVEALCDRVVVINKGKIVADDTVKKFKAQNKALACIRVEFSEQVDVTVIEKITGVERVEAESEGNYLVFYAEKTDVRKALFDAASKNDLPILGLQKVESSMEDVFKELTASND